MSMNARLIRYFCLLLIPFVLAACEISLPQITAPASSPDAAVNRFVDELTTALAERDYDQLQKMMGSSFGLVSWHSAGVERPPALAVVTLRNNYLGAGSAVTFPAAGDLATLQDGTDFYTKWDSSAEIIHALYVTGLGVQRADEAILMIARHADGAPYWRGIVVADGGFGSDAMALAAAIGETVPAAAAKAIVAVAAPLTDAVSAATATTAIPVVAAMLPIPMTIVAKSSPALAPPARIEVVPTGANVKQHGVLRAAQSRRYILHAAAGQVIKIEVASNSGMANFSITGIDDGRPYKQLTDESRSWSDTLPTTQDYLIIVASTVALPFELTVTLDPLAPTATAQLVSTP